MFFCIGIKVAKPKELGNLFASTIGLACCLPNQVVMRVDDGAPHEEELFKRAVAKMKSTPFNPHTDLAPIPFSENMCRAARAMKDRGLQWQPHAGCFVWDQERVIEVSSPFPQNIYFILNLGHFLKRFQSLEGMTQKLVWLPTWHQARQICTSIGVADNRILEMVQHSCLADRDDELLGLYGLILDHL